MSKSEQGDVAVIREALDGGVPLLHREDRMARRKRAEAALERLAAALENAEQERDEWKRKAKIDEQQAADRMKDWEVQYHAAMAAIEGRAAAERKNEQLAGALLDISGYGIAPNDGYPVVSANVVKVARDALRSFEVSP